MKQLRIAVVLLVGWWPFTAEAGVLTLLGVGSSPHAPPPTGCNTLGLSLCLPAGMMFGATL